MTAVPPTIEILTATMNRVSPPPVFDEGAPPSDVFHLVINQCTDIEPPAPIDAERMRMVSVAERGLSRSRNLALEHARAEITIIGDDDVKYPTEVADTVRRAFDEFPEAAIVTFQFRDLDTGRFCKSYSSEPFRHDRRSIASVSSVEIVVRPKRLRGLRFDTAFGLGTDWPMGEESIFLADALRLGLPIYYWPEPLCAHPYHSTGFASWNASTARTKGAVMRRMYPLGWPAALLALTAKNLTRVRNVGLLRFAWLALAGARAVPGKVQM